MRDPNVAKDEGYVRNSFRAVFRLILGPRQAAHLLDSVGCAQAHSSFWRDRSHRLRKMQAGESILDNFLHRT